jgi:hypothetical protein
MSFELSDGSYWPNASCWSVPLSLDDWVSTVGGIHKPYAINALLRESYLPVMGPIGVHQPISRDTKVRSLKEITFRSLSITQWYEFKEMGNHNDELLLDWFDGLFKPLLVANETQFVYEETPHGAEPVVRGTCTYDVNSPDWEKETGGPLGCQLDNATCGLTPGSSHFMVAERNFTQLSQDSWEFTFHIKEMQAPVDFEPEMFDVGRSEFDPEPLRDFDYVEVHAKNTKLDPPIKLQAQRIGRNDKYAKSPPRVFKTFLIQQAYDAGYKSAV